MNRNHFWKLVLIISLVAWSLYEMYPPTARPLIEYFRSRARNSQDPVFKQIVERAQELQAQRPDRAYANLREAVGTNDLTRFFPFFKAQEQLDPTPYILNRLQRESAGKIRLGLDLQGGTSFVMKMDTNRLVELGTNEYSSVTSEAALSEAVEVLRRRVDQFGVAEPVIQPEGNDRIVVQLPGLSQAATEEAIATLKKPAFLEFRLVYDEPDANDLIQTRTTVPGYELLDHIQRKPGGARVKETYLVKKRPEMKGGIKSAHVIRGNLGQPMIAFTLDSQSADLFGRITTDNVHRFLAIVLDGVLQSAPQIREPITSGSGEISGDYTQEEAFQLANVLENPLKAPLTLEGSEQVDPTLGKDSIRSGIKAAIVGVIAVVVFMLVYYLLAGVVANLALMLNIIILLGVMCSIQATFTLPGIAGVVLTIGMAVDANVLIFERIREEIAAGKSMRGALNAGYDKAFGTIFDSNLTTIIASVILIFMGSGPVKGFGVTLTIGVAVSMFTALVVTRLVFDWLLFKGILKKLPMLHLIRGSRIDFMRWAVPAFVASWLVILIGNGYGLFFRGADVLGVEFAGGENIVLGFEQAHKPEVDRVRAVADRASGGAALVGFQHNLGTGSETLRVTVRAREQGQTAGAASEESISARVVSALQQEFPQAAFQVRSTHNVGPTIGRQVQEKAVLAALTAMFMILVYVAFRYEFSFAIGAVIALIHDIFTATAWYFLVGRELNPTTVAALLTIIGFSINDTIVIFDRIREDLKLGLRGTFREIINQALNQTLSRTLITSGTVFLATLSLYFLGGGPINDFAFTFLVGILVGTYSSVYIASAFVLWWHKGQRPKLGGAQLTAETATPVAVPR